MARRRGVGFLVVLLIVLAILTAPSAARAGEPRLILGTTVGLAGTGLLDTMLPAFERQTGRTVTVVAVSAPQALALGMRGELDALLVDAPDDEPGYLSLGHAIERRLIMHADDVIVGPRTDPAQARASTSLPDALQRIARSPSGWVSRADNSGLNQLEKQLWQDAGLDPTGQPWYLPLGQGMTPTLAAATERQAYTLAERIAYLQQRDALDLTIAVEHAPELLRLYSVLIINPAKGAWIDEAGARVLAEYLLGPEAQAAIGAFGVERYGQPVFVPDAGRMVEELQPTRR